ncbi:membrane-bound inhibitor of C-type lysozyme [Bartonella fuyuanensis]|uniref:Membrane-bound inhibitor of C-type lysozyme n=1 Tax=Bartonella fuyuanensis TaxID=1460968 RepID=A0A840DW08_9HYPH|nr:MliC family protein [Bartonella fuyuanensis]MBB4075853.1 membrane-bound inhibitor of C-type lysozyme [Bartonella fuyuanensis]
MKKTLGILGFFSSLLFFNVSSTLAASLNIEVSDNPKTQTITYQCNIGEKKERIEATYYNADNISLVDFKWKGDRIIAANVLAASGTKYVGEQYIWWEKNKEVTLYDLIQDPEEKNPILCKDESTLLF